MNTLTVNPESLLGKVELLVSASLHEMVDNALKAKSPAVLTEQIRRLNLIGEELDETYALVESDLRFARDKSAGLSKEVAVKKARAKTLKTAGKMSLASLQVRRYMNQQTSMQKAEKSIVEMEATLATLTQAREVVDLNIEQLTEARDYVEQTLKVAHTQRKVVNSLDDIAKLQSGRGVSAIVEWAERAKMQSTVRLEMALEKHSNLLSAESDPDVAAELENL
ncbi:MAG: hypothetical protein ACOY3M_04785 [Patescibacteria group bacterium]